MPAARTSLPLSLVEAFRNHTFTDSRFPPERAGEMLNDIPWRIGRNAVLWPARPHPVIIRPGDHHAMLRLIPLADAPFDGNASPRPAATRKRLQAVATAVGCGPDGIPAARVRTTLNDNHFLFNMEYLLTNSPQIDYDDEVILYRRIATRFRNALAQLQRFVPEAEHDRFAEILKLLRTLPRDVPLRVLRTLLDRHLPGYRLRQWCRRFPLATAAILETSASPRLPIEAITRGKPDPVTLETFAHKICLQPGGDAARRHLRAVRLTASRSATEARLYTDITQNHSQRLRHAAAELCHAPVDPGLPATTIAIDRSIMNAHQDLAGTAAVPKRIRAFRKQLERDARRRLSTGTELPGFPHGYPHFLVQLVFEQGDLRSRREPPRPTPHLIAGAACGRLKHLFNEHKDAARAFETAFGSAAPWQKLWCSSATRQVRWNDWVRAVERWSTGAGWAAGAALQANPADRDITWTSPVPPEPILGVAFHALATAADLTAEGNALRHCVGGYIQTCLTSNPPIHLYSLRGPGNLRSTLAIQRDIIRPPGRPVLRCTHLGPGNGPPPPEHLVPADQFVQMIQGGDIPLDERHHLAERKAMLAKRTQARVSADIVRLQAVLRRYYPRLRSG